MYSSCPPNCTFRLTPGQISSASSLAPALIRVSTKNMGRITTAFLKFRLEMIIHDKDPALLLDSIAWRMCFSQVCRASVLLSIKSKMVFLE